MGLRDYLDERTVHYLLKILQETLDVVQLNLRAEGVAETAAELLEDTPRALHVDFARHLHGRVVAVFVSAQRPPERVGILIGARGPGAPWLPRSHARAGLHLL